MAFDAEAARAAEQAPRLDIADTSMSSIFKAPVSFKGALKEY
jgi:hypothetical protein